MRMRYASYSLQADDVHYKALLETLASMSMIHTKSDDGKENFMMPGGKVTLKVTPRRNSGLLFDLHVKRTTLLEPSYVKKIVNKYSAFKHKTPSTMGHVSIDLLVDALPAGSYLGGKL